MQSTRTFPRLSLRFSLATLLLVMTITAPICWRYAHWLNTPDPKVTIRLDAKGKIYADESPIEIAKLAKYVDRQRRRRVERGMKTHVVVEASEMAMHMDVVAVIDSIQEAGADTVVLKAVDSSWNPP